MNIDESIVNDQISRNEDAFFDEARARHAIRMADEAIEAAQIGEAIRFEEPSTEVKTFERSPDEIIADALSRYSVIDLRELSDDDLDRAAQLAEESGKVVEVIESGTTNLIKWWKIRSEGSEYEVRRYENFCFCSCLDFFYRKTACRHIYITTRDHSFKIRREMQTAPYLKRSEETKGELIGKIRV